MNSWFANISVNLKLALGFGLVLVFTAVLALVGWLGVTGLIQHSNLMTDITELGQQLTSLRVTRLQYMLANGDEKDADAVQAAFDGFESKLDHLLATFKGSANVAMLSQLSQANSDSQKSFHTMRNGYRVLNTSRNNMVTQGAKATELVEQTLSEAEPEAIQQYQAISQMRLALLKLRFDVRGYATNPTDDSQHKAFKQLEETINTLAHLNNVFAGAHADRVSQLDAALRGYRAGLQEFGNGNGQVVQARKELTAQGQEIVKLTDQLYQRQSERRDAEGTQARQLQIAFTLTALLLGVLAATLITRQINRPIQHTLQVVERIASGDLSHQEVISRSDELGMLQQGIQHMGNTLRELISGIRDGVTQIASAAEELSAVTEQTSAGVNNQKVETDQVATAMHEMSATVQEVARNAEQASRAASLADQEARDGDRVVGEAIAQIDRLATEVVRSADAMSDLEQESSKIGKVMDVIKAVAEQTNLLALNAAIEAARAGEAGRGFAVVADEVRGLAQRTQQSTQEIEGLIAALQSGTRQVSSIMLSSRDLTVSSVELSRKAGVSLSTITETVAGIQAMNQQIAAAAEQQSAVAEEISRSVINVRDISEQTASASEETAASSIELARLGGQLQAMVSHFRF